MAFRLKRDPIADLELQHLAVRAHLAQEPQTLHDPVVQVDEFRLGERVDVDSHGRLPRLSPKRSSGLILFTSAADRAVERRASMDPCPYRAAWPRVRSNGGLSSTPTVIGALAAFACRL